MTKNTTKNQSAQKPMKYSVKVKFVNFNPAKFGSKIIIVDGIPAVKLKDRVYTKIK